MRPRHRQLPRLIAITGAGLVVLAGPAAAAAQPPAGNPPWPARCPVTLGLLIDQSASMTGRFKEVRKAAGQVVDGLREKRTEVTVVGFGTDAATAAAAVDVSDREARGQLKKTINDLSADGGETNWEAALGAVQPLHLDVVVLITDGKPTALGHPARDGVDEREPLEAAVSVANRLKGDGTRLVAVGIELGLGAETNLAAITGPDRGQDYYPSDTQSLLRQLYEVAAASCGVPVAALPTPEPPSFPMLKAVLTALAAVLLAVLAGLMLHRYRGRPRGQLAVGRQTAQPVPDPSIDHSNIRLHRTGTGPPTTGTATQGPQSGRTRRPMSLDFLSERDGREPHQSR